MYYLLKYREYYCITDLSTISNFDASSIANAIDNFYKYSYSCNNITMHGNQLMYVSRLKYTYTYIIIATSTQLDFIPQSHPELYI